MGNTSIVRETVGSVIEGGGRSSPLSSLQVVQYVELFKVPGGDNGGSSPDDSVIDATEYYDRYVAGEDDDEVSEFFSSLYPEDSYCGEVQENLSYFFGDYHGDAESSFEPTTATSVASAASSFSGGFDQDTYNGHGSWAAGIAAGATDMGSPFLTQTCSRDEVPMCVGGCMSTAEATEYLANGIFDGETFCPTYDCDGYGAASDYCFQSDALETLAQNSGIARGARLAIFDYSYTGDDSYVYLAGNFVWYSAFGTDAKIHSNAWGYVYTCEVTEFEILYDTFMYEVSCNGLGPESFV